MFRDHLAHSPPSATDEAVSASAAASIGEWNEFVDAEGMVYYHNALTRGDIMDTSIKSPVASFECTCVYVHSSFSLELCLMIYQARACSAV